MRRFVRTFFVKRHGQYSVIQDGQAQAFEIVYWDANEERPRRIGEPFRFVSSERESKEAARAAAVGKARKLAAEADQRSAVQREERPVPEAASDALAAAKAQQLTPGAQEALRNGRRFD